MEAVVSTLKITKTAVEAMGPSGRTNFLWDTEERGFGLRVTAAGVRSYVYQYRMGGRETTARRYTIGKHGSPWTPETARREARRIAHLVESGIDPIDSFRESRRQAVDLAFSAYVERFHELYLKARWKSAGDSLSRLLADAVPILGRKPLPEIRRSDLSVIWDRMAARPASAKLLHAILRKMFRWAIERGDLERSPLEGTPAPAAIRSRDRVLSDQELETVWRAADLMTDPFRGFFQLLILTGQRRSEVAGLDWCELARDRTLWTIPASRAKNGRAHDVPLSDTTVRILDRLAGGNEWPRYGYVLTTTGRTPISGFGKSKARLNNIVRSLDSQAMRDPIGLTQADWRVHDIRRTVATGLQRLGVRFEVTEAILNHVSGSKAGVAGVYQRYDWAPEKRAALEAWARKVCLPCEEPTQNVVDIAARVRT